MEQMTPEQHERYMTLKERITQVDGAIEDGHACEAFLSSAFYPIAERTFIAEVDSYKAEIYKAAKSRLSNISNFLGRMEGVEDFWDIMTKRFVGTMNSSLETKKSLELELSELLDEVKNPSNVGSQDDPGGFS